MPRIRIGPARRLFLIADIVLLSVSGLVCVLPILNLLAISFSSAPAAASGAVRFWPMDATFAAYRTVLEAKAFWLSFGVSLWRIALALPLTLAVTVLTAYPLSKGADVMPGRRIYTYYLLIPMLFGGGLIPWYLTMRALHLTNTIWGLVVPGLVPVFNVILLMSFFRGLPKEIEDAAFIDGAGPLKTLVMVNVPLSTACLATVALFTIVSHWNSWLDGIILMDTTEQYPLQSYLQSILVKVDPRTITARNLESVKAISERTFRAAQIAIAMFPVLAAYPFLQKYFAKGIVVGSIKG